MGENACRPYGSSGGVLSTATRREPYRFAFLRGGLLVEFRQLLDRFAFAEAANGKQGGELRLRGRAFLVFPVVNRQARNAHQPAIIGRRKAKPLSLGLDGAGRIADALEGLFGRLRRALLLLDFATKALEFLFLLAQQPLQLGNIPAVLDGGLPGLADLGLNFSSGQTADFIFQDGGDIGHKTLLSRVIGVTGESAHSTPIPGGRKAPQRP